jgi:hypothetical protein
MKLAVAQTWLASKGSTNRDDIRSSNPEKRSLYRNFSLLLGTPSPHKNKIIFSHGCMGARKGLKRGAKDSLFDLSVIIIFSLLIAKFVCRSPHSVVKNKTK